MVEHSMSDHSTSEPNPADHQITSLPAITLLQFAGQVRDQHEIPAVVGGLFGRLIPLLPGLGLSPDHPTLAWYGGTGEVTDLGVGVESTADPTAGLERHALPAVENAVVVRHRGSLDGIGPAWAALHEYLVAQGHRPDGPCREVYLAGSIDRPDSWVIDLQQPIA